MSRPAESATGAAAVVGLIAAALGWEPTGDEVVGVLVVLGALPAFVTAWVASGGLRGLVGLFWRGKRP